MSTSVFSNSLGYPIPFDDHAVSVLLPQWSHIVGYEEGDSKIINAMKSGYPRFKINSSVECLIQLLVKRKVLQQNSQRHLTCFPFATKAVAMRFEIFMRKAFVTQKASFKDDEVFIEGVGFDSVTAVFFPEVFFKIVSSFVSYSYIHTNRLFDLCLH